MQPWQHNDSSGHVKGKRAAGSSGQDSIAVARTGKLLYIHVPPHGREHLLEGWTPGPSSLGLSAPAPPHIPLAYRNLVPNLRPDSGHLSWTSPLSPAPFVPQAPNPEGNEPSVGRGARMTPPAGTRPAPPSTRPCQITYAPWISGPLSCPLLS